MNDKFYCIMNGCDEGKDFTRKELMEFLSENNYEMSPTSVNNCWIILDKYNQPVGDIMKIND